MLRCPICYEAAEASLSTGWEVTNCGHIFHVHCLSSCLEISRKCPICRERVARHTLVYPDIVDCEIKSTQAAAAPTPDGTPTVQAKLKQIELLKLRIEECEAAAKDASARFEAQTIEVTDLESKVQAMGKALDAAEERFSRKRGELEANVKVAIQQRDAAREEKHRINESMHRRDGVQKREQLRLHEELRRANREVQALRLKYDTSLSGVDLQRTAMLAAAGPSGDVGTVRFDALREALDDRNKGYNRLTADLEAQQQRQQREKLQYQEQLQALQPRTAVQVTTAQLESELAVVKAINAGTVAQSARNLRDKITSSPMQHRLCGNQPGAALPARISWQFTETPLDEFNGVDLDPAPLVTESCNPQVPSACQANEKARGALAGAEPQQEENQAWGFDEGREAWSEEEDILLSSSEEASDSTPADLLRDACSAPPATLPSRSSEGPSPPRMTSLSAIAGEPCKDRGEDEDADRTQSGLELSDVLCWQSAEAVTPQVSDALTMGDCSRVPGLDSRRTEHRAVMHVHHSMGHQASTNSKWPLPLQCNTAHDAQHNVQPPAEAHTFHPCTIRDVEAPADHMYCPPPSRQKALYNDLGKENDAGSKAGSIPVSQSSQVCLPCTRDPMRLSAPANTREDWQGAKRPGSSQPLSMPVVSFHKQHPSSAGADGLAALTCLPAFGDMTQPHPTWQALREPTFLAEGSRFGSTNCGSFIKQGPNGRGGRELVVGSAGARSKQSLCGISSKGISKGRKSQSVDAGLTIKHFFQAA